jgi:hypothetical protein
LDGSLEHLEAEVRRSIWVTRFVWRSPSRNEDDATQSERFTDLAYRRKVAQMDRVEGAPEDSDPRGRGAGRGQGAAAPVTGVEPSPLRS